MQISPETLDKVLSAYKPEQRVLKEAYLEGKRGRGIFLIGPTYYTFSPLNHATDIEIQLCLNQLIYSMMLEAIKRGQIKNLSQEDFDKLRSESMLIIESYKRFRRRINTSKQITGEIIFTKIRESEKRIFTKGEFNFESESCIGELELIVLKDCF